MSPQEQPVGVSTVAAVDGTRLATSRIRGGDELPVLICNGVGAGLSFWEGVLDVLAPRRGAITWDYRGLGSSAKPSTDSFGPAIQATDALAVLDANDAEQVVAVGWSSGTRVALELAAIAPERIKALVLVCGAHGHDIRRFVTGLEIGSVLPVAARVLRPFSGSLSAPFHSLMSRPEAAGIVRQSGLIQATADTNAVVELFRTMANNDLRIQLATYEAIAGNSAIALLQDISVPVLLVGGDRDPLVKRKLLEQTEALLGDARLEIYERASHYLPLEYPRRLGEDIEGFLSEKF